MVHFEFGGGADIVEGGIGSSSSSFADVMLLIAGVENGREPFSCLTSSIDHVASLHAYLKTSRNSHFRHAIEANEDKEAQVTDKSFCTKSSLAKWLFLPSLFLFLLYR
jgi:hypothetical protein